MKQDIFPTQSDNETALVAFLSKAMTKAGYSVSQADLVNFYVSLKSKPLAILSSPGKNGDTSLVQYLAQSLMGEESLRVQLVDGHPWWAERAVNVAECTNLHERFITEKILCMLEEAAQPENRQKVFIACLKHICPAELLSFFAEVGFQLQHGQLMRIGDTHFSTPVTFPPNMFLIGTMDANTFDWWDSDLLLNTTVIQWSYSGDTQNAVLNSGYPISECEFLQSCIRSRDSAYRKIFPVLKGHRHPLFPLLQVEATLQRFASETPAHVRDEIMIYLANSWSGSGIGLFHHSPTRNLTIALDLAITQILLPRVVDALQGLKDLRKQLKKTMQNRLPRSTSFVTALALQE